MIDTNVPFIDPRAAGKILINLIGRQVAMSEMETAETIDLEAEARKLRRHFKFTEADLMANRGGVLSEKQKQRIARNERGGQTIGVVIGAGLLLGGGVFMVGTITWMGALGQMTDPLGGLIWLLWGGFGLAFGLVGLAFAAGGIFMIVSQFINRGEFKLLSIRGRAHLKAGHGNRYSHVYYDLYINDQEFDGNETMNKVIISGAEYIVYYIDKVEEIVSVELVSDAK